MRSQGLIELSTISNDCTACHAGLLADNQTPVDFVDL